MPAFVHLESASRRRAHRLLTMLLTMVASPCLVMSACASIPNGRYGVRSVRFAGFEQLDPESLRACLGTRERSRLSIDFGLRGTPACGVPPFDGKHAIIDPFSWPWTTWPLFDPSVFERDLDRVERWYQARGFYNARVVTDAAEGEASRVEPASALSPERQRSACGDGRGRCEVEVTIVVEEGEPVRVRRMSLRGLEALPPDLKKAMREGLRFKRDDIFDEALYEQSKTALQNVLANRGYAHARVSGTVKINHARKEVYLVFDIRSGPPSVVGRVCVEGFGDLPPQPMLGVSGLEPGLPFSVDLLNDARQALFSLGVFSGVEVAPTDPEPKDPTDPANWASADEAEGSKVRLCQAGPERIRAGFEAVDITIRVTPGRIERAGVGFGIQAGQSVTFGTISNFEDQQAAAQWDLHLSALFEHRNVFDSMIRTTLEIRPRLIFEMPLLNFQLADTPLGIQTTLTTRWPALVESRVNLLLQVRHDLGPMPFTGFFRSELDGAIGPERAFFGGRLYLGAFLRANWFLPTDRQPEDPVDELPETRAVWLEQLARLDLRDNPARPREGAFFALNAQQAVQPLADWDFLRVSGEVRGYVPLPLGMVLAMRGRLGAMFVLGFNRGQLKPENVYEYNKLGPPALQLRSGGASSNRGFLPGLVGDVEQVYVTQPRSDADIARGLPALARPVRISGGNTLWEASVELRVPLTTSIGLVAFADAGDVDKWETFDAIEAPRFSHLQLSLGLGLRYQTLIGPLRFDVGVRPDQLAVIGRDERFPPCQRDSASRCRPVNRLDVLGLFDFPGVFHLTIGEAF